MPIFPVLKRGVNGTFGPTTRGHYYKRVYYHGRKYEGRKIDSEPLKSTWRIKEYEEYGVFKLADEENWHCPTARGLFSILEKGTFFVGNEDEVLSFFPEPSNSSDPWHGFPVKSEDKRPSSELLDTWMDEGVVDYAVRIRIEKGRL